MAMTVQTANRWRDTRLMDLVEDINDMSNRVARNGPEPTYAGEKLEFALHQLACALVLTGMTPAGIRDAAGEAAKREFNQW